jgi:serine/threonine protein kinase
VEYLHSYGIVHRDLKPDKWVLHLSLSSPYFLNIYLIIVLYVDVWSYLLPSHFWS